MFLLFNNYNTICAQEILPKYINKFSINNGLCAVNIKSIVQDKYGFVWLGTQDGIARFDGNKFINFTVGNPNKDRKVNTTDIRSLHIDEKNNEIFCFDSDFNISKINLITLKVSVEQEFKNFDKNQWAIDVVVKNNVAYYATNRGVLEYDFNTKKCKQLLYSNLNNDANYFRVNDIQFENNENLLLQITGYGIIGLNTKTQKWNLFNKENNDYLKNSNIQIEKSTLKVASPNGINFIDINTGLSKKVIFPSKVVRRFIDEQGISLVATDRLFLYNIKNFTFNEIVPLNLDEGDWLKEVNYIMITASKIAYVGCAKGLCVIDLNKSPFETIQNNQYSFSNKLEHLFGVKILDSANTLIASNAGLFKINKIENKIAKTYTNAFKQNVTAITNNEIIVSGPDGVDVLQNETLTKLISKYPEFKPLGKTTINYCKNLKDNIFIVGSEDEKGIAIWDKDKHTIQIVNVSTVPLKLASNSINSIFIDDKLNVWVLTDNSITVLDILNKTSFFLFLKNPISNKNINLYFDMCQVGNAFYINAYGTGVVKITEKYEIVKIFNTENGLCNNGVYKIYSTSNNNILVSTNNGIALIDSKTNLIKNYYANALQLGVDNFEEACGDIEKETVMFGGINGAVKINSNLLTKNITIPKLYFQTINFQNAKTSNDSSNLFFTKITVPSNVNQVKISFVAINELNPTRVNYFIKLSSLGNDWIDKGNQNFIDLIGLKPGTYTLEVKATNEDGVESAPIKLTLRFLPKWYQTLLFKALVVLAIAGLLYLLYAFRVRQLKKIIAVRKKISADLHDDIGSTLSTINMYSQVAQLQENASSHINTIQENTKEALDKLDDIVWATNPKNDKLENLIERIENFAKPLLNAKQINFIFNYDTTIKTTKINEATRQTLFLIIKEAINNLAKYADATNCNLDLHIKNKTIHCTITDDGKGFDTNTPTERNGLLNMQNRTNTLKGKFKINSERNKGTTVNIQLPL